MPSLTATRKTTPPTFSRTIAEQYIADVLADRVIVSSWVRKAIERHQRDLKHGHKRNLRFDRDMAMRPIRFIHGALRHTSDSGRARVGNPFLLEPWQQAYLWILFGWRRTDTGQRRFRTAYCELARGNGKSKIASAIALYVMVGEGVKGAEIYSVATMRDQAKVVFDDSVLMAAASPALDILKPYRNNLHIPGTASKYQPLSSDESTLDGLKPNLIIVDELHAHKTKGVWNKCKTAMGKKPGSLMLAITTAGTDRHSVCYEQREYSEHVLDGFDDDSYFAWICCLAPDDDPFDEKNWLKSNPNLEVSIELQTIRDAAKQAQLIPTEYNEFLRMRCNIWTESDVAWMPLHLWDKCADPVDEEMLFGRPCYAGLDLSSSADLTALALVFPPTGDDEKWRVLMNFWVPADSIQERVKRDRVPYDVWIREGLIEKTSGNVIDHDLIRKRVMDLALKYQIQEVAYDPFQAIETAYKLEAEGMTCVPVRQGFISLNAPTKRLMELVLSQEIAHGGHKVLRWNAVNCMAVTDAGGLIKLDKSKSRERIDGIAALNTALARAIIAPAGGSVYDAEGILIL